MIPALVVYSRPPLRAALAIGFDPRRLELLRNRLRARGYLVLTGIPLGTLRAWAATDTPLAVLAEAELALNQLAAGLVRSSTPS